MSVESRPIWKLCSYYHGIIPRSEAESLLARYDDGAFLLRQSAHTSEQCSLGLRYQDVIYHYRISKVPPDGKVAFVEASSGLPVDPGRCFDNPVLLIEFYRGLEKSVLACQPMSPVCREGLPQGCGLHSGAITPQGSSAELGLKHLGDFHRGCAWFHGSISREESVRRMHQTARADGTFLVRSKPTCALVPYVLDLWYNEEPRHYKVERTNSGRLSLEAARHCDTLTQLIDYYTLNQDGLLCTLRKPVPRPRGGRSQSLQEGSLQCLHQAENGVLGSSSGGRHTSTLARKAPVSGKRPDVTRSSVTLPCRSVLRCQRTTRLCVQSEPGTEVPVYQELEADAPDAYDEVPDDAASEDGSECLENSIAYSNVTDRNWDEPESDADNTGDSRISSVSDAGSVASHTSDSNDGGTCNEFLLQDSTIALQPKLLTLKDELGSGLCGSVLRGTYRFGSISRPVAVKRVHRHSRLDSRELELEAQRMARLTHINIIKLYGVCRGDNEIMMVLELAPLGALHKFLRSRKKFPVRAIVNILVQVARGMEYLESVNFVHRDLAARNVLLMNERAAKISDFGMSRALGRDHNYYQVSDSAGQLWPLKWYAPECLYYFKFDSRSDVWSYGVTCWEALTHGGRPYLGLSGRDILTRITSGERLPRPAECPEALYQVMKACWQYERLHRPTFKQLTNMMEFVHKSL